ncbi:MAG TPA: metallophosphoesterase [Conexibacter sp.]|nr:metallophosphoesterase [Conexibacter sp.]
MQVSHYSGNAVFALSAGIDVLIAWALVAWAARRPPLLPRLALGGTLALGLLAVKGLLLLKLGVERHFGVIHVLWLDFAVVLPLAAALLGLLTWRRAGVGVRALVVAGVLAAPVGAYASFIEPNRLVVDHAALRLSPERDGTDRIRVALLSDIQFEAVGDHEREAVARLMAERPDVIVLTGDYHQGSRAEFARQLPAIHRLFAQLHAPGGVFAVQGDVEGPGDFRRTFAGTGVRTLFNEVAHTRVGDRTVTIGGVQLAYWRPAARHFARRFERLPGDGDVRILIAHRPDVVRGLAPHTRVDLLAVGHTHGGQVQLPLIGALSTASGVPREVAEGGLHVLDGRALYLSRGVGVERGQAPRVRFGAPPEIPIVTLR